MNPTTSNVPQPTSVQIQAKTNGSLIILSIFLIILAGIVVFMGWQNYWLQKEVEKFKSAPSPSPSATMDPTASWKTYTNTIHQLTFKYPPSWSLDATHANEPINAILILMKNKAEITMYFKLNGIGGLGRDYLGEPYTLSGMHLYKYETNDSENNTIGFGITDSLTQSLGVFSYAGEPYSITLTYPKTLANTPDEKILQTEFDQILSTFQFLPQPSASSSAYTCPQNGYVDCMPVLNDAKKASCSSQAITWYKANCPNFKGVAM